jgi:hypothetical protein
MIERSHEFHPNTTQNGKNWQATHSPLLTQAAKLPAELTTKGIDELQIKKAVVVLDNRPFGGLNEMKISNNTSRHRNARS